MSGWRQEDLIRQRAYEIWEQSGRPDGKAVEHWRQAEEEISKRFGRPRKGARERRTGFRIRAARTPATSEIVVEGRQSST